MSRTSQRVGAALLAVVLVAALRPPETPAQEAEQAERVAPFVPTPTHVVVEMLELAGVTHGDTVYDLGSGDGRLPIAAARLFRARGVGVELDSALVAKSRRNAREAGVDDRVRFIRGDLFETDLRPASVVTLYLFPAANLRLRPALLRQLDPGDRVVAHDFAMGEWEADSVVHVPGAEGAAGRDSSGLWGEIAPDSSGAWTGIIPDRMGPDLDLGPDSLMDAGDPDSALPFPTEASPSPVPGPSTLYLWVIPADVEGDWRLELPDGGTASVHIDQRFQELRIRADDGRFTGGSAAVRGETLHLTLQREDGRTLRLQGTVRDGRMEGRTAGGEPWSARRVGAADGSILEWEEPSGPVVYGSAP